MLPDIEIAPVVALTLTVLLVGLEQMLQWRYGPMGVIGLALLGIGVKARNVTCACLGVLVIAMLLAPEAA